MREDDLFFMQHALELAERARGHVSPNPLVGAVVVAGGAVVGEGYHARAGEPHAEVMALDQAGERAQGATIYVTLEPCNHYGRTPPCSLAILRAGVQRVVFAVADPNLEAAGGAERLSASGIEVEQGLLATQASSQNVAFFHTIRSKRPLVLWKAALTLDGRVDDVRGRGALISSRESHRVAHAYRQDYAAVAVGAGTLLTDDPALTVRDPDFRPYPNLKEPPELRDPLKLIFDRRLRTPKNARVFAPGPRGEAPRVVIFTSPYASRERVDALEQAGVRVVRLSGRSDQAFLRKALNWLLREGVNSVLLEGGPTLAGKFLEAGLIDRMALFVAPQLLGRGQLLLKSSQGPFALTDAKVELLGRDLWIEAQPITQTIKREEAYVHRAN